MAACSGLARKDPPLPLYAAALPPGFPSSVRWAGEMPRQDFINRLAPQLRHIGRSAKDGRPDILVLSGGGVGGAFGAGVLSGWSRLGTRPSFEVVTGVSAGALIAPFAFLGPAWDAPMVEAFSAPRTRRLLRPRWLAAPFGASLYQGKPLRELVDSFVTERLLRAVAAESSKGRLLLVATTDLDSEQTVVWNMGAIAERGGSAALKLFRDVLTASASVPGFFPPVLIHVEAAGRVFDEMHVDGGTTAPLLFAPGMMSVLSDRFVPLRGGNVYMVVDGQLREPLRITPVRTMPIFLRGLTAALDSDMRSRLALAYSFSRRHGMRLRVTVVPADYPYRSLLDFGPSEIKALFDYGRRCAFQRRAWADVLDILEAAAKPRTPARAALPDCPAKFNISQGPRSLRP
jgi:hypothetical protein